MREEAYQNEQDMEQQGEGDMPGEDEPEWQEEGDEGYDEDEYADLFGDGEEGESNMDMNEEQNPPQENEQNTAPDQNEPWENQQEAQGDSDPNGDLHDKTIEQEAGMDPGEVPGDVLAVADVGNHVMETG